MTPDAGAIVGVGGSGVEVGVAGAAIALGLGVGTVADAVDVVRGSPPHHRDETVAAAAPRPPAPANHSNRRRLTGHLLPSPLSGAVAFMASPYGSNFLDGAAMLASIASSFIARL
jgi:hypothetical protein